MVENVSYHFFVIEGHAFLCFKGAQKVASLRIIIVFVFLTQNFLLTRSETLKYLPTYCVCYITAIYLDKRTKLRKHRS